MPFKVGVFDAVFSYSVLQHFDETEVEIILAEIARVLGSGGVSKSKWLTDMAYDQCVTDCAPSIMLRSTAFGCAIGVGANCSAFLSNELGPRLSHPKHLVASDCSIAIGKVCHSR
jgi:ubiquinone/menaquinone biosynthesis C-methylase UbiE